MYGYTETQECEAPGLPGSTAHAIFPIHSALPWTWSQFPQVLSLQILTHFLLPVKVAQDQKQMCTLFVMGRNKSCRTNPRGVGLVASPPGNKALAQQAVVQDTISGTWGAREGKHKQYLSGNVGPNLCPWKESGTHGAAVSIDPVLIPLGSGNVCVFACWREGNSLWGSC